MIFNKMKQYCEEMNTHHRFLWPRKALGMPVRMRRAPSTPNPGSILVSRCRGSGAGVAVVDVVLDGAELVAVGLGVTVRTMGTTVAIGMTVLPDRMVVEIVAEVVVREREAVREAEVAPEELFDD